MKTFVGKDEAWKLTQRFRSQIGSRTLILHSPDPKSKHNSQRMWHEVQKIGIQGVFFQVNTPFPNSKHLQEAVSMFRRTAPTSIISLGSPSVTEFGKGLQTMLGLTEDEQRSVHRFRFPRQLNNHTVPHIMIPNSISPHCLTNSFYCLHDEDDVLLLEPSNSPDTIIWDPSMIQLPSIPLPNASPSPPFPSFVSPLSSTLHSPSTSTILTLNHLYSHLLDSIYHFTYQSLISLSSSSSSTDSLSPSHLTHIHQQFLHNHWEPLLPLLLQSYSSSSNPYSSSSSNSSSSNSPSPSPSDQDLHSLCHLSSLLSSLRNSLLLPPSSSSPSTSSSSSFTSSPSTQFPSLAHQWTGPIESISTALALPLNSSFPPSSSSTASSSSSIFSPLSSYPSLSAGIGMALQLIGTKQWKKLQKKFQKSSSSSSSSSSPPSVPLTSHSLPLLASGLSVHIAQEVWSSLLLLPLSPPHTQPSQQTHSQQQEEQKEQVEELKKWSQSQSLSSSSVLSSVSQRYQTQLQQNNNHNNHNNKQQQQSNSPTTSLSPDSLIQGLVVTEEMMNETNKNNNKNSGYSQYTNTINKINMLKSDLTIDVLEAFLKGES